MIKYTSIADLGNTPFRAKNKKLYDNMFEYFREYIQEQVKKEVVDYMTKADTETINEIKRRLGIKTKEEEK